MGKTFGTAISIVGALILVAIFAWLYLWISPTPALTPPSEVSIERANRFERSRDASRARMWFGVRRFLLIYGELTGDARRIQPGIMNSRAASAFRGDAASRQWRFASIVVSIPEGLNRCIKSPSA